MFNEIREMSNEVKAADELLKKNYGYRKIKPEKEMTFEEIERFWIEEIQKLRADN